MNYAVMIEDMKEIRADSMRLLRNLEARRNRLPPLWVRPDNCTKCDSSIGEHVRDDVVWKKRNELDDLINIQWLRRHDAREYIDAIKVLKQGVPK